jgi:hypothetical protein
MSGSTDSRSTERIPRSTYESHDSDLSIRPAQSRLTEPTSPPIHRDALTRSHRRHPASVAFAGGAARSGLEAD